MSADRAYADASFAEVNELRSALARKTVMHEQVSAALEQALRDKKEAEAAAEFARNSSKGVFTLLPASLPASLLPYLALLRAFPLGGSRFTTTIDLLLPTL